MTTKPTAVFRFDASAAIGGGHAVRSGALAAALAREGWRTLCAVRRETAETVPGALRPFDEVVRLGAEGGDGEIDEIAARVGGSCQAAVIDHYGRDWRFDRACRRVAPCVAVIEDRPGVVHDCDILVNQVIEPVGVPSGGAPPARLVGPRYALLREDFREARGYGVREGDEGCLLLLCGYTDERNLTERLFDALDGAPEVRTIHMIIGSANPHRKRLQKRLRRAAASAHLHVDPSPLADLMARASLAVTAAGSTCWELACLGIPMVTVVAAANQAPAARTLRTAGASEDAGEVDDALDVRLRERVAGLLADGAERRCMAARGRGLVDGRGAARVAQAIGARALSHERSMA